MKTICIVKDNIIELYFENSKCNYVHTYVHILPGKSKEKLNNLSENNFI